MSSMVHSNPDYNLEELFKVIQKELDVLIADSKDQLDFLSRQTKEIEDKLISNPAITNEEKLNYLIQLLENEKKEKRILNQLKTDVSKIRYIKGLEVIKILYEKILSLDHHFSSIQTFSEINRITNPNEYPEFHRFRKNLEENNEKKNGFKMSEILQSNSILSVISTFTNMVSNGFSKKNDSKDLKEIECILDFSVRMYNDVNTIYFETNFLKSHNEELKKNIEELFELYTKPIDYITDIHTCRMKDDWEQLRHKLNEYINDLTKENNKNEKLIKRINIEFPIDRLLSFIDQYNAYIGDAEKYYQKFLVILSNYENEETCLDQLPFEYSKLKRDVEQSINKFQIAYKPVEINGSGLKAILYGINQFD